MQEEPITLRERLAFLWFLLGTAFSPKTWALWSSAYLHEWGCPNKGCLHLVPWVMVWTYRMAHALTPEMYETLCKFRSKLGKGEWEVAFGSQTDAVGIFDAMCEVRDAEKRTALAKALGKEPPAPEVVEMKPATCATCGREEDWQLGHPQLRPVFYCLDEAECAARAAAR